MTDTQSFIDTYSQDYCAFLEAAYGSSLMSEGGEAAVDRLLAGVPLRQKKVLDLGAGLGGAAVYVAQRYQADVTGLELGEWMVGEANRRVPQALRQQVRFQTYNPPRLPFADGELDVVFSKGVLVHVHDKLPLLQEIHRVLKPGGRLMINDWMSPVRGQWGAILQAMADAEHLLLYADSVEHCVQTLTQSGFHDVHTRDESAAYIGYNHAIIERIERNAKQFAEQFGAEACQLAIRSYQQIAESIVRKELVIMEISAVC